MQRDVAAGREPELDAIAGAVLRAGAPPRDPLPDDRVAGRAGGAASRDPGARGLGFGRELMP